MSGMLQTIKKLCLELDNPERFELIKYLAEMKGEPSPAPAGKAEGGEALQGRLLQYIGENPGQRIVEVAAALKLDIKKARRAKDALVRADKIGSQGKTKAMRYYLKGQVPEDDAG